MGIHYSNTFLKCSWLLIFNWPQIYLLIFERREFAQIPISQCSEKLFKKKETKKETKKTPKNTKNTQRIKCFLANFPPSESQKCSLKKKNKKRKKEPKQTNKETNKQPLAHKEIILLLSCVSAVSRKPFLQDFQFLASLLLKTKRLL